MPYVRYESETGLSGSGAVLRSSPDFYPLSTASEASNRQYIGLPVNGAFVQWTISQTGTGEGVTLRFTLPDNATGDGVSGSLAVFVNGVYSTTINPGSYWAWTYFNSTDPINTPGSRPCLRFDEIHFRLAAKLQAGDVLKIVKTNGDAYEYGIDFVEVENVPDALLKPAGFVSVADYGANGNDAKSDSIAFDNAWQAAKTAGTGLYIPAGKYLLDRQWGLGNSSNLHIQGAGIWYTELFFSNKAVSGGGILSGKYTTGLEVSNFFMSSALNERFIVAGKVSDFKAFNGPFGLGSSIHDVWITHFEAGVWVADYTVPVQVTSGFDFARNRVRYLYADGINFSQGTRSSSVRQCDFRGCGDDAMAVWPSSSVGAPEAYGNVFSNDTVEFTYRAADVGIFGGYGHQIHHCLFKDGIYSAGIRCTEDFSGYHFENNTGGIQIYQNTFVGRGTSQDVFSYSRGAVELSGATLQNIYFTDNDILNSPRHAIQLNGGKNLTFTNLTINATGLDSFNSPAGAAIYEYGMDGSATFVNLVLVGIENYPAVIQNNNNYGLTVLNPLPSSPYEMEIVFTGYDRVEPLSNFPVLVKLGPAFPYHQFISGNGDDLRFHDASQNELKYQIESWSPGGISSVWVQVPRLQSNGSIWAAWGNPNLASKPDYINIGGVWSQGYAAVYHASEGTGTRHDSSPAGRNGAPVGNVTGTTGIVAGCDQFGGNGDGIRMPKNFGLFSGTQNVTVEFWFKANAVAPSSDYRTSPVLFQARGENAWMITFGDSQAGNSLGLRLNQGGWASPAYAAGIQTDRWYHFTTTYSSSGTNNWKIYLDGTLVSQGTRTGTVAVDTTLNNQYGGSDEIGSGINRWFNGSLDEVRVSSAPRSANWVWASWKNMYSNDTFATYGQAQYVGALHTFSVLSGSGGTVSGSSSGSYIPGTSVAVTALPGLYYHWGHWTGDLPGNQTASNPLTLAMDQDRTITAVFEADLTVQSVPHWWLAQYGWTTDFEAQALADPDGDGQNNAQEYFAGTDPTHSSSVFRAWITLLPATSEVQITWPGIAGKLYRVEQSSDLSGTWSAISRGIPATAPLNTFKKAIPASRNVFFRVGIDQ
ncbi:MAG: DUF2341 domain-containing protein [Verrucomicrobiota bacterium]